MTTPAAGRRVLSVVSLVALGLALGAPTSALANEDADAQVGRIEASPNRPEMLGDAGGPAAPLPTDAGGLVVDFVLTGELEEGDTPQDVVFSPDGTEIIVASRDSRNLIVFDAATRVATDAIAVNGSPVALAVSSDGTRAVTANVFEGTASIIDLTTGLEIDEVVVGNQPGVVRITPDGATAVVGNVADGSLSVIDIATATEARRIAGVGFTLSVTLAFESGAILTKPSTFELADNTTLVHPDFFADVVHFVDITTGAINSVASAADPRAVAITPDGATAVVAHTGSVRLVSVIDVATQVITKTIPTGIDLSGSIAVNPGGTKAAVTVQNAARIVNLVTDTISGSLSTLSVNQLLTTADGDYVLCVGFAGSLISYASESIVANLNNVVSTAIGAVSPTEPRAAMIANAFGEDMVVVNTNGAAGFIEGVVPSGPPPEGDKARMVAVSPDGTRAVVTSVLSDNASLVDLATQTVEGIVDVGNRPSEAAITPDGTTAVVANLDSFFTSIVDLGTQQVTNVNMGRRGSQVQISPDGQYAYVAVVADGDGVWRINLTTLMTEGKVPTGNMGGIFFQFQQTAGMTLSHDGATLVTCNNVDDTITLIDTASWSVLATVPVGDQPVRAIFSDDDTTIYVTNKNSNTITLVNNAGAGSAAIGTVAVGGQPFEMALAGDGGTLYVANYLDNNIGVVDVESLLMTTTVAVPSRPAGIAIDRVRNLLYVPTGGSSVSIGPGAVFSISLNGEFTVIDLATNMVDQQVATDLPPAQIAFHAPSSLAVVPSPYGDGVTLIQNASVAAVSDGADTARRDLALRVVGTNPLLSTTELELELADRAHAKLSVHDALGRTVAVLADRTFDAGTHSVRWDTRMAGPQSVAAGVYFARLEVSGELRVAKLVVVD